MKKIIEQAFRQYVSGVANLNKKGEVKVKDEYGNDIFIVFLGNALERVLVRRYWGNRKKRWEREYQSGQKHGKSLGWYESGKKWYEEEYQNGQQHGKSLLWYENGQKWLERECQDGQLYGKLLHWDENGKLMYQY